MSIKAIFYSFFYFIVTALVLCIPAFYNRYVLFYTDSALYLESAMTLLPTIDRPIGYSFFIRAVTWQTSLWLVIFFQGLTASLLIYHALKTLLVRIEFKRIFHFFTIIFLTAFTTLGWFVSQLMPDVFTSFLIIAVFNVIFGKNNAVSYVLYSILFFFIIFSHLSNIPILIFLLAISWIFILLRKTPNVFKRKALLGTAVIVVIFICTLVYLFNYNYRHYSKASLSPTGSIFFFARLIDTGVIDTYLEDNCNKKDYKICQYKDSIPPSSQIFLWHTDGIFYKMGGWYNYQDEPQMIVKDILTSPKYYRLIAGDFAMSTINQLYTFKVGGDFLNFVDGAWAPVYQKCLKCFPKKEMKNDFRYTRQSLEELNFDIINPLIYSVVILSLILIILVMIRFKLGEQIYYFVVVILSGVVINAVVCANLSNVLNRYQARVVWLIPFVAIVLSLNYLFPQLRKK